MITDTNVEYHGGLSRIDLRSLETSDSGSSCDKIPTKASSHNYQLASVRDKLIDDSSSSSPAHSKSSPLSGRNLNDSSFSDSDFVSKPEKTEVANPSPHAYASLGVLTPNDQNKTPPKDNTIESTDDIQPVRLEGFLKKQAPWFVCRFAFALPTNKLTFTCATLQSTTPHAEH